MYLFSEIILDAKTITNLCTTKLLFLEFGDRKSMQRSHLQWPSEMPQNPTGEQQGSPLLESHSATGPPSHTRFGNLHLPSSLTLVSEIKFYNLVNQRTCDQGSSLPKYQTLQ